MRMENSMGMNGVTFRGESNDDNIRNVGGDNTMKDEGPLILA